ncbi:PA2169 family four-helix-bundle protein [Aquincola sp. MAHUQ-54]|uniref:PA2169 family four-helix-bundle protein n=1 Tax=Aquincola agrisoli TaxID=3119538 RepID=A0AAW9Q0T6_9BURK
MNDRDLIDLLNDLIETSKDGEYGFTKCAERANAPALKETLQRRAADCARGAAELQTLVVQYGGKPEDSGTAMGALHRGWVSVKDVLSGNSDHAVLAECERGEDAALARYRKALREELPADVRQVLERQMTGVQANHDQIKALRDSTPA